MALEIKVDDELVKGYVAEAIFKQMTPEKREEILKAAVVKLLTPEGTNGYGRPMPSLLQQAYDMAVTNVAREMLTKDLADNDAFKKQVRALYQDAFLKVFDEPVAREELVTKLANEIGNTISNLGYRR